MRHVMITEQRSGLAARCLLLDEQAPRSCAFLWDLATRKARFEAMHAMWTGPEISIPMPAALLPGDVARSAIPEENATSYPAAGDVVLAYLPQGSAKGLPPGDFYDVGLFYGDGGRLLMPFGWTKANVCARVVEEDLAKVRADCRTIRHNGVCDVTIEIA